MKRIKLFLTAVTLAISLTSCKDKKEKWKLAFNDCHVLEEGYKLIKQGEKKSSEFEEFIKNLGIYKIDVEDPISDLEHSNGQSKYSKLSNNLTESVELDYNEFDSLINKHLFDSDYLKIQYVYLSATILEELIKDINESEKQQVIDNLEKNSNNLYAILTFVNKTNEKNNKSYLIFNLGPKSFEINIVEKNLYDDFNKNISPILGHPTYIAKGIKYDLLKAKLYIGEIRHYVTTCNLSPIAKLRFDFCYGSTKSTSKKESIFMTSIPIDSQGLELKNFPYYDQGSLEP
ncbi:hypothetical protein [Chryseobacterium sp.]|uniref:hypothetical protein n=1 Tax=Chryseobacterium sp. TaxID=1871047 RepID=UPI0035C719B8